MTTAMAPDDWIARPTRLVTMDPERVDQGRVVAPFKLLRLLQFIDESGAPQSP